MGSTAASAAAVGLLSTMQRPLGNPASAGALLAPLPTP
jgi:hypothetical protein